MLKNSEAENLNILKLLLDGSPPCHKCAYGYQTVIEGLVHFAHCLLQQGIPCVV